MLQPGDIALVGKVGSTARGSWVVHPLTADTAHLRSRADVPTEPILRQVQHPLPLPPSVLHSQNIQVLVMGMWRRSSRLLGRDIPGLPAQLPACQQRMELGRARLLYQPLHLFGCI